MHRKRQDCEVCGDINGPNHDSPYGQVQTLAMDLKVPGSVDGPTPEHYDCHTGNAV